jgi:hypothetical protein
MIDLAKIDSIVLAYEKHGWMLRRLLVPEDMEKSLEERFSDVRIARSEVPAAWFSRPPALPPTTWEIRSLGDPPFALLESIDESAADLEDRLRSVEDKLRLAVSKKRTA